MKSKTLQDSIIGLIMGMGIMLGAYYLIPKESILKLFPNSPIESVVFFSSSNSMSHLRYFLARIRSFNGRFNSRI